MLTVFICEIVLFIEDSYLKLYKDLVKLYLNIIINLNYIFKVRMNNLRQYLSLL